MPPEQRRIAERVAYVVFVGDLVGRGPDTVGVLKLVRKLLAARRERQETGLFAAEGEDLVAAASAAGWRCRARSCADFRIRFARKRIATPETAGQGGYGPQFEIEAYLESHAQKFTGQFDPNCYLYLSRAMDNFDLAESVLPILQQLPDVRFESVELTETRIDLSPALKQVFFIGNGATSGARTTMAE